MRGKGFSTQVHFDCPSHHEPLPLIYPLRFMKPASAV